MAKIDDEAGLWSVVDTNAYQGPRTHEMADRTRYPLVADKATPMPRHHAAVFMRDPAFRVFDEDGNLQITLPDAENTDARKARPMLEMDETIAKYSELVLSALQARAALRPGFSALPKNAKRDDLIAFLEEAPRLQELPPSQRARASAEDLRRDSQAEDMDDAAAKKMLGAGADPLAMGA